eukprot:CAMPEP_0179072766 /NCGR_PEP_ID=MMETSP0796-20121207/32225_1 /TAXON_ID=73915 /ORGANISM="Pyrodinium bahamense, Strain pbaha01" /LENGTH=169 /DNA_ID=CAMNT_0020769939 /DNA_START=123 /DNA_END=633 /DNA_ORIENTATION=-
MATYTRSGAHSSPWQQDQHDSVLASAWLAVALTFLERAVFAVEATQILATSPRRTTASINALRHVAVVGQAVATAAKEAARIFGFAVLLKQKRMFRGVHGTLNPSLWRWYHRNGYWATRRKKIDFGTKRRYRYNQVVGDGKRGFRYEFRFHQFWMDKSYYKPYKNYCRF